MISSLIIISFFLIISRTEAQTGTGRVNVGIANSTEDAVYSFNENYVNDLEVPVYITVVGGDDSVTNHNINISCELNPEGNGYSSALFTSEIISYPETDSTVISFSNAEHGRRTTVLCWAEPEGTPPDDFPEFSKDVSIGDTGLFEIRPPGTVSTCSGVELVPDRNDYSDNYDYQLYVELSEPVEIGNVSVVCSQTSSPAGSMSLEFEGPVTMVTGQRRAPVRYRALNKGTSVVVDCTAETVPTTGDQQFILTTSTGQSSLFMLESGSLVLEPDVTNLRTTEMSAYLVLDSAPEDAVTFYCSVDIADDVSQVDDIINAPGCTLSAAPGGTEAPVVTEVITLGATEVTTTAGDQGGGSATNTSGWVLRDEVIEISDGSNFAVLNLYKTGDDVYAQSERPELVVLRCCAPDGVSEPKYADARTGLLAVAYLSPNYTTNWDRATDPSDEEKERTILEPQYVEMSGCPCNLTIDACDVDCCCDPDCTSRDKDAFYCIPGAEGGQEEDPPDYRCSADYFGMADWFPFMCVQFENSAFLGYFRQPKEATRSDSEYNDLADDHRPGYSFEEEDSGEKPPVEEGGNSEGYTEGIAVKSALQSEGTLLKGVNYRLTLPGRTASGECVWSAPIRYLRDQRDSCVWRMTRSLCSATSPLNALNYALPSQGGSALCRKGLLLLAEQGIAEVAFTNVDYLCASDNDTLLSPYLRSNATAREVYPEDGVRLFDEELPNRGDDCHFDEDTGAYICEELVIGVDLPAAPVPPRCAWDDGNTDAPLPDIDDTGDVPVCRNAVVDVYYNFTWSGPEIVQLNATVILGDIPLEEMSYDDVSVGDEDTHNRTFLTQLLKVEFVHDMNYSVWESIEEDINEDPNEDNVTLPWTRDVYERSGKEGYLDNLPIISGVAVETTPATNDSTGSTFKYVDTNLTSQLTLWSPGVDGLCENAGRTHINFSQNAIGSCLLRLGLEELQDCNYTRKLVLNRQDNLMLANYVAMTGDPNPRDLRDWIQVLRENISSIFTESPLADRNTSDYVNDTTGICPNIPAGIHVDIMWAKAGEHNGTYLNDIVGAKIRYTLHTWSLYCTASSGAACYGDTRWRQEVAGDRKLVQSFTVQSSVSFIQVPPEEPAALSAYDEAREKDYYYCRYDTCWEEAFYPWTQAYRGIDKDTVLGTSLALLLFLIGLYMISRPWY